MNSPCRATPYIRVDFGPCGGGIVNKRSPSYANEHSLMSPRTKQIDDLVAAEHAARLLIEAGPKAVTFAEVGKRCGLAPPTLVQRFGGKDQLVAAATALLRVNMIAAFSDAARQPSPISALTAALQRLAAQQAAIVRAGSRPELATYSLELRKQICFLLAAAVEAGELPRCDVALLARTLQITFAGAVAIAILEGIDVMSEVAAAVEVQLANYI
jgi:AcrR family transcriptional regulator